MADTVTLTEMGNDVEARFWAKVDVRGPDECWPWVAKAKTNWGYGVLRISPSYGNEMAHRISHILANGGELLPKGVFVLHSCDNPVCCNPKHLRAGTPAENMQDMITKGRRRIVPLRGERNGRAKLSAEQVRIIRSSNERRKVLVERYGVCPAVIYAIRRGSSWKDVA